ncbi:DEAD/DEAH box helicase [Candidatus Woesearchaeota archaeon]|nr:DEAD/DEAH box helicase [Candidatus Woesearchaeota archaeon]
MNSIEKKGFEEPTEIQEKSIPVILQGKDVIGGSATGSGKTLAFSCAIIHKVVKGQGIQAIVLAPTRELADQVAREMKSYSIQIGLNIVTIYGGIAINPQIDKLKTADVVVGTPGRVLDHLSRETLDLSAIKIAVLDEADRMLDMGFIDDVRQILAQCPKKRQTLLYSATISSDLARLAEEYMINPVKIAVEAYVDPSKLSQVYYQVQSNMKFSLLVHLLKEEESSGLVMVFCNTQRATDYIARNLQKQGIHAIAIHGGLSQAKRNITMEKFHSGKSYVLVCTDVAARGLHVENVSHVYNYDIPNESKQYIHRIGRTARAGNEGKAINILTERDYDNFNHILDDFQIDIKRIETPWVQMIQIIPMASGRRNNNFRHNKRNNYSRRY